MLKWKEKWIAGHEKDDVRCIVKCSALAEISDTRSLRKIAGEAFREADALVFFCAVGIAVRSIAPFLQHKSEDIAVLVVDELGKFCIPILSGHAGGANALAAEMAELSGAVPVVTTATDLEGKFAVDDFARKNKLTVTDWKLAKKIAVRILEGEQVEFCSELPVMGAVPEELKVIVWGEERKKTLRILVTDKRDLEEAETTLQLVPRRIAVGIGCRKGTTQVKIRAAVAQCLEENGIRKEAVFAVASIALKEHETGLIEYCKAEGLPFRVFDAEQLRNVEGNFTESAFVKEITGVENVCERSAVCAVWQEAEEERKRSDAKECGERTMRQESVRHEKERQGTEKKSTEAYGMNPPDCLLCRKRVYDGVTVALAEKRGGLYFE